MNESQYLAAVAAEARAGLMESSRALGEELVVAVDLERVVQRHPWWSVGISAGGGWAFGRSLAARARHSGRQFLPILLFGAARILRVVAGLARAGAHQPTGRPGFGGPDVDATLRVDPGHV